MLNLIMNWLQREEGQDMVEYVLLIVLIALVVALAIPTLTGAISTAFGNIAGWLTGTT